MMYAFSVLGELFGSFVVLDDFFFGFAVSNTPQCPSHWWKASALTTAPTLLPNPAPTLLPK